MKGGIVGLITILVLITATVVCSVFAVKRTDRILEAVEGAEDVDALREARTLFEGYELLLSLTLSDDHIEQTRCAFNDCIIYTDEGGGVEAETAKYRLICLLEQIKRYSGINPSSIF